MRKLKTTKIKVYRNL